MATRVLKIKLSSASYKTYCNDTMSAGLGRSFTWKTWLCGDSHMIPNSVRLSSRGLKHSRKPKYDESLSGLLKSLLLIGDALQDRPQVFIASWRDILKIGCHVGRKEIQVLATIKFICGLLLMDKKKYLNRSFWKLNSVFFMKIWDLRWKNNRNYILNWHICECTV